MGTNKSREQESMHIEHEQHDDHAKPGKLSKKHDTALITHPFPKKNGAQISGHVHQKGCGHEEVIHERHFDYVVEDRLIHVQDGHTTDHGKYKKSV